MNILARVTLWALLVCFPVVATATPSLEVGVGLICNSEAQVHRFIALQRADQTLETAIQLINDEEHDPAACSLASIAFVRGQQGSVVSVPGGQMIITQITVMAAQTQFGWQQVPDLPQYTAIFEKLEET